MNLATEAPLLRFSTAGSVDDGKSTLIGRLLLDTRQVMDDQLSKIADVSRRRGFARTELGLLTDGLRAEREQGITIDVAYRYFGTLRRRFVVADTPGHVQYTRNMVTGASTAEAVVILVDARKGPLEQTRRHAFVSALLGIRRFIFCVNKMDLVEHSQARFEQIEAELRALARAWSTQPGEVVTIPVSALHGDNIVTRSLAIPWYEGPTLLAALETSPAGVAAEGQAFRFPVQWVIRPAADEHHDFRAYAGRVASGIVRVGEEIEIWPSRRRTRVVRIELAGEDRTFATRGDSVNLHLEDDVDVTRGDLFASVAEPPRAARSVRATISWFSEEPLRLGTRLLLKHATRTVPARVERLLGQWDMRSISFREDDPEPRPLEMNGIGLVDLATASPLVFDPYARIRETGGFILIDASTNDTVAAGLIEEAS